MEQLLPEPIRIASPIVRRLRAHEFEAVFVGGCVRDTVLGLPIKDVDIATSARPEQVMELFERCIPTGLQHGTVTVLYEGSGYEVTTFRQESSYEEHRKPESVLYITSLEGDLLRRDFTMNAMAMAEDGELLDPFGGLRDLETKVLRCVGDADARFQEDALRMLRAVRFIGAYHLIPAHHTWKALIRHRKLMKFIAMERVQAELDKMMAGAAPQRALYFVGASGLLLHLKEPLTEDALLALTNACRTAESASLFSRLHQLSSLDLRWAAVGIGLSLALEDILHVMQVLRFSNQRTKSIAAIFAIHKQALVLANQQDEQLLRLEWIKLIIRFGESPAKEWIDVLRVLTGGNLTRLNGCLSRFEVWLNEISISSLKQLKVNGSELKKHLRRKPGPWISDWLNRLLVEVANGQLVNDKQQLLKQASEWDKEDTNDE
ncbi:CCA tRNA nucleotidyltransferase [Paenibacillus alkaliterrae]|uniref:CCA tRNA nucleotidyltransferase n=1 Tax=Paenibacillus alkaliterrae TaxID=320909 RepID=UPI001F3D8ECA|nr:CCA tRNA nucleotidyltransferase [Paenibacillus alkaliterrae]MCF2937641.1 CCA tRNA nucleotidyltransferase [Paenibacillus alkaliterrae]